MNEPENSPSRETWTERLFRPVDIASLAAFRIVFGGCMLFENARYWIEGYLYKTLVAPEFHFKFYGFTWIEELPAGAMLGVFTLMILSSLGVLLGAFYRTSATILFVTFSYCFLLEACAYRNHFYLLALLALIMIFLPAARAWSVDAKLKPAKESQWTPQWTVWLLQFQLGIVYFFAGVAKIDPIWISGESFRAIIDSESHSSSVTGFLKQPWVLGIFIWSGMLFDLTITFFLLWARTRWFAFLGAAGFHLTNALFLVSVGIFPWFMLLGSTIFFPPNWPRALLSKIDSGSWPLHLTPVDAASLPFSRRRSLIVTVLAVHVAIQIFLPLRQHLYPGNTSWTHEGHRWAWRMKLVPKSLTSIRIFTVDPDTGQTIELNDNIQYAVAPWQRERMGRQPDLLLQFVHDLDAKLTEKLGRDFPIYADVRVTMDGNLAQPLIDPTVDLSKERWELGPASWIAPYHRTRY